MSGEILKVLLASALVISLFAAGRTVYQRLPGDEARAGKASPAGAGETEVTIVLRLGSPVNAQESMVAIYPFDFQALQREFSASTRTGRKFDDFLAQRMREHSPVRGQFDSSGRTTMKLAHGIWWIHARLNLAGDASAEWRLPLAVAENKQTVELSAENIYEKTKKF